MWATADRLQRVPSLPHATPVNPVWTQQNARNPWTAPSQSVSCPRLPFCPVSLYSPHYLPGTSAPDLRGSSQLSREVSPLLLQTETHQDQHFLTLSPL